jgi:hypothetical protein
MDEANNNITPLSDLTFSPKLGVNEFEAASSRTVFEVHNPSALTAPVVRLIIIEDAGITDTQTTFLIVSPLLPGERLATSVPMDIQGRRTFIATLDLTKSLTEVYEDNNVLSFSYTVAPLPDLQIVDVLNRPSGLLVGEIANT